jgi:transcription initiation factor TFIID subunit 2
MQLSTKPNNFSDFTEYFVRLAIVTTVSRVRDQSGAALPHVVRFLINLLTLNDNSTNPVRFSSGA